MMIRLFPLSLAAALFSILPLLAGEQVSPTPVAEGNLVEEVHSLRYTVEAQSKQIAGLSEQIAELRQLLQSHAEPGTPPPAAPAPAPAPSTPSVAEPPAAPAPAVVAPEAAPAAEAPAPRAEPTGGGVRHVVAKGETLTSIAKLYNIPIAELHKANKIANDRKLQIGQVLSIPTKSSDSPNR